MPELTYLWPGFYRNRAGTARQVLIVEPGSMTASRVIWQNPGSGQVYRCTRRSFLTWLRSHRRPVPERAPRWALVDGQAVAQQLATAAATALEAARAAELAQLKSRLTSDWLTGAEASQIRQRCLVLSQALERAP
jgi:hypothetical protein